MENHLTELNHLAYSKGLAEGHIDGLGLVRIEKHEPSGARKARFERQYWLNGERITASKLYRLARAGTGNASV